MKLSVATGIAFCAVYLAGNAQSIDPLLTFGGGDGWLAPTEGGYTYLGTGNNERGMAFGNGHLYLVSRTGGASVRILNSLTGAEVGTLDFGTGIVAGGTFVVNMAAVGGDGAIYVANLASPLTPTTPFNVYRWANEAAMPTLAFTTTNLTLGRLGDTLAATGSGASTRIAAGESNSSGSGARNGYAILSTADGANFTGSLVSFTNTNAGDFRLGLTFRDANSVIGTAGSGTGGTNTMIRVSEFSGTTGTLLGSPELSYAAQRPMAFATVGGIPLLATESTVDATVRVYDLTDPATPVLIGSRNNTSGTLTANANGTGQLAWGDISGSSAKLWALSSNQGIQGFLVTVPEPGVLTLLGLGCAMLVLRRRGK